MLRCLCRIYDVMLLAYPANFRREYGREMAVTFRDRARGEWTRRGAAGLLFFVPHILADWLQTVVLERLHASDDDAAAANGLAGSGIKVISLFAPNNVVAVPGTAADSRPVWLLLGCLGVFLLIEGWVRWLALMKGL
jgi:hypothetical protein